MNTSYDPSVIQRFANRLYRRAASALFVSVLLGAIIGLLLHPMLTSSLPMDYADSVPRWAWPAVFAFLGVLQGMERVAGFQIQAQTALCQMQIEQNTRIHNAD